MLKNKNKKNMKLVSTENIKLKFITYMEGNI